VAEGARRALPVPHASLMEPAGSIGDPQGLCVFQEVIILLMKLTATSMRRRFPPNCLQRPCGAVT
jgi:hypothetical protein